MSDIIFNAQNEVISLKNKNNVDYKALAKNNKLSEAFILENADFLDWGIISEKQALTVAIMLKCTKKIKWIKLPINPNIPADAVVLGKYKGNLSKMSEKETISEDFFRLYKNVIDWAVINTKKLSNEFLEEMSDKVGWVGVFMNDRNDEVFLRKNLFRIEQLTETWQYYAWLGISYHQTVSEQFLRDFEDKIRLDGIASTKRHILSDAFVEDFKCILESKNVIKTQSKHLSKAYLAAYKKFDIEDFYQNVSESWIENYLLQNIPQKLDWIRISSKSLSEAFILKYWDKLRFYHLALENKFTEEFTRKIIPQLKYEKDLQDLFGTQSYSESFLSEYLEKKSDEIPFKINLKDISSSPTMKNLSEDFLRKHATKWDFVQLCRVRPFSEDFIKDFAYKFEAFSWSLAISQQLSESFLRDFAPKFDVFGWSKVAKFQKLSEQFIRDFKDKLDWQTIAIFQDISSELIDELVIQVSYKNDEELMLYYNKIGWDIFENKKDDQTKLEQALKWVEKSLFHKSKTSVKDVPTYADDTKVRILILLKRNEEAYSIVKWALDIYTNFEDFQDFKTNKDYLNWLKNNN